MVHLSLYVGSQGGAIDVQVEFDVMFLGAIEVGGAAG